MPGVVLLALGCATPPRAAPPRARRATPPTAPIVRVHGSGDCLGVRLAPGRVLTAAHCVLGVRALHEVRVTSGGRALAVRACALHPGLRPMFARCDLDDAAARAHLHDIWSDAALLRVDGDAPDAPAFEALTDGAVLQRGARARVWVVSDAAPLWADAPAFALHADRVTVADAGELRARGSDRAGFSTRPGDSGGPCLVRDGAAWKVAGVLHGGRSYYSPDSSYAPTFAPDTAAWLRAP